MRVFIKDFESSPVHTVHDHVSASPRYGSWTEGAGLSVSNKHIWQRRGDLKVRSHMCILNDRDTYLYMCILQKGSQLLITTLPSIPYLTVLDPEANIMEGMFAEVFKSIQASISLLTTSSIVNRAVFVLQEIMNFTYFLTLPPDKQWGIHLGNGSWTGMVGMLQDKEVDIGKVLQTQYMYSVHNQNVQYEAGERGLAAVASVYFQEI